ncbi:MAG: ferredoxin family protein [Candidatus Hodarchaeota archaeon]
MTEIKIEIVDDLEPETLEKIKKGIDNIMKRFFKEEFSLIFITGDDIYQYDYGIFITECKSLIFLKVENTLEDAGKRELGNMLKNMLQGHLYEKFQVEIFKKYYSLVFKPMDESSSIYEIESTTGSSKMNDTAEIITRQDLLESCRVCLEESLASGADPVPSLIKVAQKLKSKSFPEAIQSIYHWLIEEKDLTHLFKIKERSGIEPDFTREEMESAIEGFFSEGKLDKAIICGKFMDPGKKFAIDLIFSKLYDYLDDVTDEVFLHWVDDGYDNVPYFFIHYDLTNEQKSMIINKMLDMGLNKSLFNLLRVETDGIEPEVLDKLNNQTFSNQKCKKDLYYCLLKIEIVEDIDTVKRNMLENKINSIIRMFFKGDYILEYITGNFMYGYKHDIFIDECNSLFLMISPRGKSGVKRIGNKLGLHTTLNKFLKTQLDESFYVEVFRDPIYYMENKDLINRVSNGKLMKYEISIDFSRCEGCMDCQEWCVQECFDGPLDGKVVVKEDADCIGCGECVDNCPNAAIKIYENDN